MNMNSLTVPDEVKPSLEDYPIVDDYYDFLTRNVGEPIRTLSLKYGLTEKDTRTILEKDVNKQFLAKKVDSYFKFAEFERIRVMEELKNIAYANFKDILTFDGKTVTYHDWKDLPDHILASISEVKQIVNNRGETTTQIKQHNKLDALKTLANILKMQDHTLKVEGHVEHTHRLFDNIFEAPPIEAEATPVIDCEEAV